MAKILIIEDELSIQNILKTFLENEGHTILLAADGKSGIQSFQNSNPDLILLDIMLPKIDGFSVCKIIRETSLIPIIMLTALDGEMNQIKGFDLLVDDYITKPFSMDIVIRRIQAILRRNIANSENQSMLTYKKLKIDTLGHVVFIKDKQIELTSREYEILKLLLENQGRVYSRDILLDIIWNYEFFGESKIINTHIKNIRKKIGEDYITTIRGVGYKIDKEN